MNKILRSFLAIILFSTYVSASSDYLYFSPDMIATHVNHYSDVEKEAIEKDLKVVRSVCFSPVRNQINRKPIYLATAGGPGARKSTILERFLHDCSFSTDIVYVDPDQRGLKFMPHTYYSKSLCSLVVAEQENYLQAVKNGYEKWRGASNYITLTLLEEAFAQQRDIAHGTTSTGEYISTFLPKVKAANYEIILLLCSCDDSVRQKAVKYRNEEQKFYQNTPEDAVAKGILFPQRIPTYFAQADTLYLYWSDDLFSRERLAAIFTQGNVEVKDQDALDKFIQKYEYDRVALMNDGKQIPSWEELVSCYFCRFLARAE